jgi:hypothetical protein
MLQSLRGVMATERKGRFRSRQVVLRPRKMLVGTVLVGLLALVSCVAFYFVIGSQESYRQVDLPALQERVRREQPVGASVDETVAFLRNLGFEDRYIRIRRYSARSLDAGKVLNVEAWIPQPRVIFRGYDRVAAYCRFSIDQRLEGCDINSALPFQPANTNDIDEMTPIPTR